MENKTGIAPFGLNVLLKMPQVEEKTVGGVYLPDNLSKTTQLLQTVGLVIAKGEDAFVNAFGERHEAYNSVVGHYVVVNIHSGMEIKVEDETYRLVSSDEIRACIDKETYKKLLK